MTAIEQLLATIIDVQEDLEDAYSGRTKVSATRARKAMMAVKKAASEVRKELLAISKGEMDPVDIKIPTLVPHDDE